jgi:hypothetical protein
MSHCCTSKSKKEKKHTRGGSADDTKGIIAVMVIIFVLAIGFVALFA